VEAKKPKHVLSVLNLTADFIPPPREKLSKLPVLKPKSLRHVDRLRWKQWIPHYRVNNLHRASCHQRNNVSKSFSELLKIEKIKTAA
jgi:hypothetical protein